MAIGMRLCPVGYRGAGSLAPLEAPLFQLLMGAWLAG